MIFERPWMSIVAAAPLVWAAVRWRGGTRKAALALKAFALAAILLALAEPSITLSSRKVALALLADTSLSVPDSGIERESRLAAAIERSRGRNIVRLLPFARSVAIGHSARNGALVRAAGDNARATNLEAAIRQAIATLPAGMLARIALVSDGLENEGSVARAAWQARDLGIPIDTFPLAGRPVPALRLESASAPAVVFSLERFPVDLVVGAPRAMRADVSISAEGREIGSAAVDLIEGQNRLTVTASLAALGTVRLSGAIRPRGENSGDAVRFDTAVTLRRPRVLYVSADPPGTGAHLTAALSAAQFDVTEDTDLVASKLDGFQVAILNNIAFEAIPPEDKRAIERFVERGGGLLVLGGERETYAAKKTEDALDRTLPAKLAPPRSHEGACVVIVIDKSSSMEGKKIELARLAAIGVVDHLRPIDQAGVLIFDNSFQWAVPLRHAGDRAFIARLIAGIVPDGGTQIAPALSEAFHRILPVQAAYKHIVLLTDGISEEGDSLELAQEAARRRVTISTVGLGQDVNRAYLEKVAAAAEGKSYFLSEPEGLQQILLRDVREHTGSTAVEKDLRAEVARPVEALEGTGIETAPPLKGYVRFTARPEAEAILTIGERDPLLVRWQYGLGRSAVFTSDAKSRWASEWVAWQGFARFWANVIRDLLPRARTREAGASFDAASGELVAEYRLGGGVAEPAPIPEIYVLGPDGFERPMPIAKVAGDLFRGRVPIGERRGLFRVRPLAESRAFPEIGLYREEQEPRDYGADEALLREVASFTGGRFNPPPEAVFDSGGRSTLATWRLWPGLLALAVALNLLELGLRKGPGIGAWWRRRQPASS